jgi:hypothetical protein
VVDRGALAGSLALTGGAHRENFQIPIKSKYINKMKKTIKEKLVDYMLENGNDFTYTSMIKKILQIVKGPDYEYNYKSADRGFYATNFNLRWNGYMVNGRGTCGVFKNPSGLWSARYYKNNKSK